MKIKIWSVFKTFISISLIIYIINSVGLNEIILQIRNLNITFFSIAFIFSILNIILAAKRWKILLETKLQSIPFLEVWKCYYYGMFFNAFFPSTIGGDTIRAYYISKKIEKPIEAVSSIIIERFIELTALVSIGIFSLVFGYKYIPSNLVISFVLSFSLIGMLFLSLLKKSIIKKFSFLYNFIFKIGRSIRLKQKIISIYSSINEYKKFNKELISVFFLSVLFQILAIFSVYVISLGLNFNINIAYFFIFVPITIIILLIPISIQGFGIREGIYVYLFSQIGVTPDKAVSLAICMHLLRLMGNLIGGIVYTLSK